MVCTGLGAFFLLTVGNSTLTCSAAGRAGPGSEGWFCDSWSGVSCSGML